MTHRILLFFALLLSASSPLCAQVATVLDDVTTVDYVSPRNCTTHRKTVLQVNNERGLDYATFAVGCDATTSLVSFSGEVSYARGGKPQKLKKGDLTRSEYSTMLATDAYRYVYAPQPAAYPFTVTYEWTTRSTDAVLSLDVFCPQPGYEVDVKQSSYAVVNSPDVQMLYALRNVQADVRKVPFSDGRLGLMLEVRDLPAVKAERQAPPFAQVFPHAYFVPSAFTFAGTTGVLTSWAAFGKWLDTLRQGRDELPAALKTKLHALTDSCATPRQKLLRVYRLLEDETRYVSIQLGIGGMRPASAADVCKYGFGDCKGLSNLMVAMLSEMGVEADYVVIGTRHEDLPADFANVALLDHAIARARLPEGDVWIECTNPQLPLGYVHSNIAGHEALVVSSDPARPSEVVRLPHYDAAQNVDSISVVVHLERDGAARITVVEMETNLMYEAEKHLLDLPPDKQRDQLRDQLALSDFSFAAHDVQQTYGDAGEKLPALSVAFDGSCRKYANVTGSRLFVPLLPYGGPVGFSGTAPRTLPVHYGFDEHVRSYHLELFLPEGFDVENLPSALNEVTDFGSIRSAVVRDGAKIIVDIHIERSPDIPVDRYPDLSAFVNRLADFFKAKIVLKG